MRAASSAIGRIAIACGVALAVGAVAVASLAAGPPPLVFNHAAHTKAKVDCTSCHLGVMDPSEERLPTIATCVGCHKETPKPGDPAGKHELARLSAAGATLSWPEPTVKQPDHVFFSHPRHVDVAKLECATCHGKQPEATGLTHEKPLQMAACMKCHASHPESVAATRAARDCLECHR